jgi:FMN reductase
MRPLFAYLRASVAPTAVFAATDDFGSTAGGELAARVARAADELATLLTRTPPVRREPADPFDDVTPFEELLGRSDGR